MNPTNPSMTVVIPAYNAERFILATLESVSAQHRRDVEILVVDDGSDDGTVKVVEQAIDERHEDAPQIKLIRQKNEGVSAARNQGIGAARARLIAFLDSDDLWHPKKVARHLRLFETHPEVDLSFTGFRFIDENGVDLVDGFDAPVTPVDHSTLLLRNLLQTSTVVGRTEAIERAGGFDASLRYYEDYDLWLRIAAQRSGNILGLRDRLVDYRRHSSQATQDWNAMHSAWKQVIGRARERDPDGWEKAAKLSTGNHLEYCAALAYNAGQRGDARRLMLRAWGAGGPRMIASPYARSMTAITVASILPKALQRPLGRSYLELKKVKRRLSQFREAEERNRSLAPFNAYDGLWRPEEDTARKVLHDQVYSGVRRVVGRARSATIMRALSLHIDGDEARTLADRCQNILRKNLAPFFLDCADPRHSGYLENADEHGFYDRGDKWLIKQARNLWSFSYMARHDVERERSREMADRGFEVLQSNFLDREHGGYFDRIRSDGSPLVTLKLQRHQAHAISALCEYAALTGSSDARQSAISAFDALDQNARLATDGGYHDCLLANWSVATAEDKRSHQTYDGARHLDAELHMLEALTLLHKTKADDRINTKLTEQIIRLLNRFSHDRAPANLFYHRLKDDVPVREHRENMHATYGHDLELIWFVFDALESLGIERTAALSWARRLADYALRHSFDPARGGFFDQGRLSGLHFWVTGRDKIWWVQADAMVSMLEMYKTTWKPKYADAFRQTLGFVDRYLVAPDGGWYRSVDRVGKARMPARATANQGPYHSVRSMIRCAKLLDDFSK